MSAFQEAMSSYFDYYFKDLMTAIPAIVVSADRIQESVVAVKPVINETTLDGRVIAWPELVDVPLIFPSSTTSAVTFPIGVGDTVLLVFSMRGMDEWKGGDGGLAIPTDRRTHSLQDAVAIPGLYPISRGKNNPANRTNPHNVNDMSFTHNIGTPAEAEVRIRPSGQIEITTPTMLVVNSPETTWNGNITLSGNLTQAGNYSIAGMFTYNGEEYALHRHTDVQGGNGVSGPKA